MRRLTLSIILCTLIVLVNGRSTLASTIVSTGDASIAQDGTTWDLSAGGATLSLAAGASRDFEVLRLTTASSVNWTIGTVPDTTITIGGRALPFGNRAAGFAFVSANAVATGSSLQFDAVFDLLKASLTFTRHYRVTSGSPTFETWTTYTARGAAPPVSDLNGIHIAVPAGTIHWLTGLQGDNADTEDDSAFTLEQTTLGNGGHFSIGAQARASERSVPWVAIDAPQGELFAALMWSGAWSLTAERVGNALALDFGLASMSTSIGPAAVDGPHVVFGVTASGLQQATAALRSYILDGLRGGRPFPALVTYNTWFSYGTEIDEESMRAEMDHAAALGAELFVVDAGWYTGAGADGPFDFDSGLGSWTPDPARFPDGLGSLTDYAHGLGMKFGLWVEPERVNLSTVGSSGVNEAWLATAGGAYGSDHAAQLCLASDTARQWVLDRLTQLLDAAHPDYLKWDNNMFVNCDRAGHGHGATDGNFAHVSALYAMLGTLRDRYPSMLIENVSGGGNRLDLGMLRYTDAAWMDDRTAPSVHVRHNVQGLSAVFPPAYLLSFVLDREDEPLHESPDLPLYFRSRTEGALGLCFLSAGLSATDAAAISHEIGIAKMVRGDDRTGAALLLTPQAEADDGPPWDVLQQTTISSRHIVLSAVQSDQGVPRWTVKPTGLDPATIYDVVSVDTGLLGSAAGEDLMTNGIDLQTSPASAAHVLIVTARPQ